MTTEKQIPQKLVDIIFNVLGEDNLHWFRIVKRLHGDISPVLRLKGALPVHPIHLREGMQIRNIMRESGLCDNWSTHDFDNLWTEVVERAIAMLPTPYARRNGLPGMSLEKALECLKLKEETVLGLKTTEDAKRFAEPAKIVGNAKWGEDNDYRQTVEGQWRFNNPELYEKTVAFQKLLAEHGIAWHNPFSDECTPDFGCCTDIGNYGIRVHSYDRYRKAVTLLTTLLQLKDHKDAHGKDNGYEEAKDLAWKSVREFLASIK